VLKNSVFGPNVPKLGDRKCLGECQTSIVGHRSAISFFFVIFALRSFSTPTPYSTPSKVTRNLFGINPPKKRTFIPTGGPQADENSLIVFDEQTAQACAEARFNSYQARYNQADGQRRLSLVGEPDRASPRPRRALPVDPRHRRFCPRSGSE